MVRIVYEYVGDGKYRVSINGKYEYVGRLDEVRDHVRRTLESVTKPKLG